MSYKLLFFFLFFGIIFITNSSAFHNDFNDIHHIDSLIETLSRDTLDLRLISSFKMQTGSPSISITSPVNNSLYSKANVWLNFTINETADWMAYSLDGNPNVSIPGNQLLSSLAEGSHSIVLYANNSAGNMGSSSFIWFTIDTVAPIIDIICPGGGRTNQEYVWLNFTINEPTSWIGYSLDWGTNITITGNTLLGPLGEHPFIITIFANDTAGNMAYNYTGIWIDLTPPVITVLSPENKTYFEPEVWLNFSCDSNTKWNAYSIDNNPNVSFSYPLEPSIYNQSLSLEDGIHSIVVYAQDNAGNMAASSEIWFTVDLPLSVFLTSPLNSTYSSPNVWLNISTTDPTSWVGYSLDNSPNITLVTKSTLLSSLSEGLHSVIIYANDTLGRMVSSSILWFTIDTTPPEAFFISPRYYEEIFNTAEIFLSWWQEPESFIVATYIDNVYVSLSNNTSAPFTQGRHNITIVIQNQAGNVQILTHLFWVDLTPPVITILSPLATTYTTTKVELIYRIDTDWNEMKWNGINQSNFLPFMIDIYLNGIPHFANDSISPGVVGVNNSIPPIISNNSYIPGITTGEYNLTIFVIEPTGNKAIETVLFQVVLPTTTTVLSTNSTTTTTRTTSSPKISHGFEIIQGLSIIVLIIMTRKKCK